MSIIWLVPAAMVGLVALAVPILVHLLTRQERKPIAFPSLRFLRATRLAAMRRRRIHDWPLLVLRLAAIAAAVAALAGPLLITPQRERAWDERTARAIVTVGDVDAAADEIASAFSHDVIPAGAGVANAIRAALDWLQSQPPATREVVIAGDLREDALQAADLSAVPGHVGIRFLPETGETPQEAVTLPVMTLEGGRPATEQRCVRLTPDATIVEASRGTDGDEAPAHRMEVRAIAEDQQAANAALAALLAEGVMADAADARHVIVIWPGPQAPPPLAGPSRELRRDLAVAASGREGGPQAPQAPSLEPQASAAEGGPPWIRRARERLDWDSGEAEGALLVHLSERPTGTRAVAILREIATVAFDDPAAPREPRRISAAELARLSRPPGPAPADAVKQDEGDRRALWALSLALLMLEWAWRRSKRTSAHGAERTAEEMRVA